MADIITYPENGITYDADDASGYLATRLSGVYSAEEDFSVTAQGGLSVQVSAGQAWVRPARFKGRSIIMEQPTTVVLTEADPVRSRIDRIVLRYDAAAKDQPAGAGRCPEFCRACCPGHHPHRADLRPLPCRDQAPCRLHRRYRRRHLRHARR